MNYLINHSNDHGTTITVYIDGRPYTADEHHPNFAKIIGELTRRAAESVAEQASHSEADLGRRLRDLFDISVSVGDHLARVSERLSLSNGRVYFDGDLLDNVLTRQIVRFYEEDADIQPLVRFLEKLETNPNPHSREHLYRWLKDRDFTIAQDGDFIAYKGVTSRWCAPPTPSGTWRSTASGRAIVNGEVFNGLIPTRPGDVVEMPRSEVVFDPANVCSAGLHVATLGYAKGFGDTRISVKVNPRDVVSVPTEAGDAKMRVCRYEVIEAVVEEYPEVVHGADVDVAVQVESGHAEYKGKTIIGTVRHGDVESGGEYKGSYVLLTTPIDVEDIDDEDVDDEDVEADITDEDVEELAVTEHAGEEFDPDEWVDVERPAGRLHRAVRAAMKMRWGR